MAKSKTKESKKAQPATPLTAVKNGGVTKASQTPKAKAKELAKAAAQKVVKEKDSSKSKKKKVVEPESSSEEEEDSDSESEEEDADSSSDSSESSDEEAVKKPVNGKAKVVVAKTEDSSDDSEDDSEESEDEKEATKPVKAAKANGTAKPVAAKSDSDDSDSDDSDSDEESEEEKPAAKAVNGKAKPAAKDEDEDSDDSDSDDDDEESADSDDSEEETEAAAPAPKKRKAEEEIDATPKKSKTDTEQQGSATLFAGSLSWSIDDDALYEAFKEFDGLVGARVVSDKMSGRSRGFGYVDFADSASANKAIEAMQGKELDGRAINLDHASSSRSDATPQARASERAKKHGDTVSPESDTLFVGNLPFDVDQDVVREFFGEVAQVAGVRLPTDPETGNFKGFAYVSFNSVDDAKTAFQAKSGASIGSGRSARSIRLDFASARPPQREGGGGFGGRGGGFGGRGGGGGFGGRGGRGGGGRGGDRGRGRGGGRGGFSSANRSSFSGTKISFD